MANRAYPRSWDYVVALNRTDLEFDKDSKNEKAVLKLGRHIWIYSMLEKCHLSNGGAKRVDLLVELLHRMAQVFDYDFDKTHIKNSSYSPMAHGNVEDEHRFN